MVKLANNDMSYSVLNDPVHAPSMAMDFATGSDTPAGLKFLTRGSLIVEITLDQTAGPRSSLVEYKSPDAVGDRFELSIDQDANIRIQQQFGGAIRTLKLNGDPSQTHTAVRITFSWDVLDKIVLLSVEAPESGYLSQAESQLALPMPMEIIDALLAQKRPAIVNSSVTFLSVSNKMEPVGINPSIEAQSLIDTPIGQVPICALNHGDLVTTLDNGAQPIRWIIERLVPTRGLFQPLRLRAPYFGLTQDVHVAPEQRVVFENTEVEYMFGVESVLVETRHLINNVNVIREPAPAASIHLFQLLFDDHEIITVAGCQMESLFIGQIANSPEMLKSTLLAEMDPTTMPVHKEIARPLLRSYEAMALQKGTFL